MCDWILRATYTGACVTLTYTCARACVIGDVKVDARRLTYRDASRFWYQDDALGERRTLLVDAHLEGNTSDDLESLDRNISSCWSSRTNCLLRESRSAPDRILRITLVHTVVSGSRYWGGISRNSSSQHTRRTDTATAILRRRTISCATDHTRKTTRRSRGSSIPSIRLRIPVSFSRLSIIFYIVRKFFPLSLHTKHKFIECNPWLKDSSLRIWNICAHYFALNVIEDSRKDLIYVISLKNLIFPQID